MVGVFFLLDLSLEFRNSSDVWIGDEDGGGIYGASGHIRALSDVFHERK